MDISINSTLFSRSNNQFRNYEFECLYNPGLYICFLFGKSNINGSIFMKIQDSYLRNWLLDPVSTIDLTAIFEFWQIAYYLSEIDLTKLMQNEMSRSKDESNIGAIFHMNNMVVVWRQAIFDRSNEHTLSFQRLVQRSFLWSGVCVTVWLGPILINWKISW